MAISGVDRHEAFIYDRGAQKLLFPLFDLGQITWSRVRDDISDASVKITNRAGTKQIENLNKIMPGRHEMVVFREGQRVWEGPLNLAKFTSTGVELGAKDPTYYLRRLIMKKAYSSAYPHVESVISRISRIIQSEAARRETGDAPINILPYLTTHDFSTDARTSAKSLRFQMYVWEHLDNLSAKNGIDYTTIGRALHIWDTSQPVFGQTPRLSEADFDSEVAVTLYGAELATYVGVTDGQGHYRVADHEDPYYGVVEQLYTAYDEANGGPLPTLGDLYSQARRNLAGRYPTPAKISIPENSGINLKGQLKFEHLVPGIYMPVVAKFHLKKVQQMQKLNKVTVTETSQKENIQVSLTPASAADDVAGDA